MIYKRTYGYMKELIQFNEIESLEEVTAVQKRMLVISFFSDASKEEKDAICKAFDITPGLLFNLINIKNDEDDIAYIEKITVNEIFIMQYGTFQSVFAKALNDIEDEENKHLKGE